MEVKDISRLKIEKPLKAPLRKRRRRIYYWIAGLFAASAVFLWFSGAVSTSVEVRTGPVVLAYPSQALSLLNASGYVVAQRKASVASKTTGRLVWIGVEEGSIVKEGEEIARLENDDFKAAMDAARFNLRAERKNLEHSRAELDDASLSYNRDKELFSGGVISKSEYDASFARYKKAEARAGAGDAAVAANEAGLRGAEVNYENTLIRAPFDAVVLAKNADIGDIITPLGAAANAKAAVVSIADMDSLQVEVDVSESNIAKVKTHQPCEIQLDALPEARFAGTVHMIVPTADRSKASVLVKVRFKEKDPRILPEMSAKVSFLRRELAEDEKRPRIAVDPSSVVERASLKYVFVVNDGRAEETVVKVGAMTGDLIEVLNGLKPGQRAVLNPPAKLKTGSRVSVMER